MKRMINNTKTFSIIIKIKKYIALSVVSTENLKNLTNNTS